MKIEYKTLHVYAMATHDSDETLLSSHVISDDLSDDLDSIQYIQDIFNDPQIYSLSNLIKLPCAPVVESKYVTKICNIREFSYRGDLHDLKKWTTILMDCMQLPLARFGLVVAGGIFSYLKKHLSMYVHPSTSDIDLFIVGSREEAMQNVANFMQYIKTECAHRHVGDRPLFTITNNCITFMLYMMEPHGSYIDIRESREYTRVSTMSHQYQIILRYHDTPDQIIQKFDLAPAMVYYHDGKVYMNAEAAYAYCNNSIILNLNKRRNNFGYRLNKYIERDFSLILHQCEIHGTGDYDFDGFTFSITDLFDTKMFYMHRTHSLTQVPGHKIENDSNESQNGFYTTSKVYKLPELIFDNMKSIYNKSNNIAGVIDHFTLQYKMLTIKDCRSEFMDCMLRSNVLTLFRYHIISEETAHALFDRKLKNLDLRVPYETIATNAFEPFLDRTFTASLEHFTHPMYEAACPYDKSPQKFFGKYYRAV